MQLDPNAFGLAPAQGERRMADAHDEGIASGACLGEDLDVLPAYEAELEEPPLERGEGGRGRADADDPPGGPGRERGETHEAGIESESGGSGYCVHDAIMDENRSHLQSCCGHPCHVIKSISYARPNLEDGSKYIGQGAPGDA